MGLVLLWILVFLTGEYTYKGLLKTYFPAYTKCGMTDEELEALLLMPLFNILLVFSLIKDWVELKNNL